MKNKIALLDIFIVLILSISFTSLSLLTLNIFNVYTSIIFSAIFTLLIFWIKSDSWELDFNLNHHLLPILMLLLIGLLFRVEPYHYIAGGQDEGLYVNMSEYYKNYGKPFVIDELRKSLPDNLKTAYDSANLGIETRKSVRVEDEKEGTYLPGVYLKNLENSEYVFQFYQLHPLWMSIFSKLFGDENQVYSLVFFSLLSLVAFYLLAFEFTKNKYLAFCAGGLLAINPLHAFFSKFPVTEVVALTFTTLSFYYLLKYYNLAKEKLYFPFYLVLSSLLMCGMFFVRISGFMYIPFFYLILLLTQLYISNPILKQHLKQYVLSIFVLYGISVWYGLVFSYPYASDIYRISFSRALGGQWLIILPILLGLLIFFYFIVSYISRKDYAGKVKDYVLESKKYIPYAFLVILGLGMYKVYQLGFTDTFDGHKWFDLRWKAAGTGWSAFLYSSTIVVFEYLSPFIFIIFSYLLFTKVRKNNTEQTMLILFVLLFFIHISLLQWFIPYQYYYARYLLSEALPFILLFTVIGLNGLTKFKYIFYMLIWFSVIYMLFFTTMQFKGKEMHGFHASLSELKNYIGHDDILILDKRILHTVGEIKTSLKFYYNYNVLSVNNEDKENFIDFFCSENKNVYLFNSNPRNKFSELIKFILVKAEVFEHTNHIPMNIYRGYGRYYLSKISCSNFIHNKFQRSYTIYEEGTSLGGVINFIDHAWTNATSSLTYIDIKVDKNKYLVLETYGWNPIKNIQKLNLNININGDKLTFVRRKKNKYFFTLSNSQKISNLDISCNTFIPKEFGINQDGRALGIDIKSIKLVEEINK